MDRVFCCRRRLTFRLILNVLVFAVVVVLITTKFREAFYRERSLSKTSKCLCDQRVFTTTPSTFSNETKPNEMLADYLHVDRRNPSEVSHIAFLKVHKCASSTMLNIFYRFGYKRGLNFVLPIKGNYLRMIHQKGLISVVPPPAMSGYDILCNHVPKFSKEQFSRYLPPDTKYIAIVREPFQRMYSAFHYYRNLARFPFLAKVGGLDPFQTYLNNITSLEALWGDYSVTNNKMARDFGFPTQDYKNISKFKTYLKTLDKQFHLVMVSDMFLESLVLLRRLLKWSMEDVIFLPINVHEHKHLTTNASSANVEPFLALDRILYGHYVTKLKEEINAQGPDFHNELQYLKVINAKASAFCNSKNTSEKRLSFMANEWHGDFSITPKDCHFLAEKEIAFLNLIRNEQYKRVELYGANIRYFQ